MYLAVADTVELEVSIEPELVVSRPRPWQWSPLMAHCKYIYKKKL